MTTRALPGAPRKRSNSLPAFGESPTPRKEEAKQSVVSPFTLSAHKRKEAKESKARQNHMKSARLEDDDDDDSETGAEQQSQATDDTVDESFFDLLKTFAGLDLPDENAIEQCPLCPLTIPLTSFADHVYECIKQLDPEEKKEQLRLDEQLAHQLSAGQMDEPDFKASSQGFPQGTPCPQGSQCRKYDQGHHRWFAHPQVACPICTEEYTVFAIDAHVSLCLDTANSPSAVAYFGAPLNTDGSDTSMNQSSSSSSSSSLPAYGFSSSPFPFQGDAFSAVRGDGRGKSKDKNKSRKKVIEEDEGDDADDDDGEDEDEEELPPLISPTPLVVHMAPSSARGGGLSRSQMKAMAIAVIDQKSKPASKQDVSLVSMLETFRGLGFTKESLSQEINKDKVSGGSSGCSMSSSSLPLAPQSSFSSLGAESSFAPTSAPAASFPTFFSPSQTSPTTTTTSSSSENNFSMPSFPTVDPALFSPVTFPSATSFSTSSTSVTDDL